MITVKAVQGKHQQRIATEYAIQEMAALGILPILKDERDNSIPLEDIYAHKPTGMDTIEFLKLIYPDAEHAHEAFEKHQEYYEDHLMENVSPIDGARETLEFLIQNKIPFFIASASPRDSILKQFTHFFGDIIAKYPDETKNIERVIIGRNPYEWEHPDPGPFRSKPAPDMLQEGFRRIKVRPDLHDTIYVGNSVQTDVHAAVNAGVRPVLFGQKDLEKYKNQKAGLLRVERAGAKEAVLIRDVHHNGSRLKKDTFDIVEDHAELREYIARRISKEQSLPPR